jgi:uncharacterized protein YprB with RNaseH-like and TPR domain
MIHHSFIHIPGIGPKTEIRMWQSGITSLKELQDEVEMHSDMEECTSRLQERMRTVLEDSIQALDDQNWMYFYQQLPSREHWRLLPCFNRIAFLDIETTGLGYYNSYITVIGIYDGKNTHSYIHGDNLDDFAQDIRQYDAVVTYNGKTFDLPFIKALLDIDIHVPHIDLRYPLKSLGFKGGLKKIEQDLDINRKGRMKDIDGFMAVLLWNEYINQNNSNALDTLLAYNLEDVINLEPLSSKVYNMKLLPEFSHLKLSENHERPSIPYSVDEKLIERLSGR